MDPAWLSFYGGTVGSVDGRGGGKPRYLGCDSSTVCEAVENTVAYVLRPAQTVHEFGL